MKSIVCQQPGDLQYIESEKPIAKNGEVVIKIRSIGICGTDIHAYGGNQPFFTYPRVLGHELAGVIDSIGENVDLVIGKDVYVIPYLHCGNCSACKKGKTNCCTNIEVIGVHADGGMCEYLAVPASHVVVTDGIPYNELAIIECLAIGAHAVRRAEVNSADTVMVLGSGPIGLGAAQFAKEKGAITFIADVNEERLAFCEREYNFDAQIDCKKDVKQELERLTQGSFPTVIIDATGNPKAMESTFDWLAHGGTLVFVSVVNADITFNDPEFHKRETTLKGSRNATREDFQHVVDCLKRGRIKSSNMITHIAKFEDFSEVFNHWLKPEAGVVKAVVEVP